MTKTNPDSRRRRALRKVGFGAFAAFLVVPQAAVFVLLTLATGW